MSLSSDLLSPRLSKSSRNLDYASAHSLTFYAAHMEGEDLDT